MKSLRLCLVLLVILISTLNRPEHSQTVLAAQQNVVIEWDAPQNISNSPDNTSTDPFLLADPSGKAHLFWAEKMGEAAGNQPDTLLYTVWDGATWRRPIDLFFSPGSLATPIIAFPRAVIDDNGKIHLFWMAQPNFPNYTLFYSSAFSGDANNAMAWEPELRLVDDLTGTKASIDVQFREPGEIHIVFARVQQGANPPEERAISYIKSTDYGETWSDVIDIYSFDNTEHGGSDTRILLDSDLRVYTTWSEWDETGNGLRVWFSRSMDNGITWDKPIILDERIQSEYERDWANIVVLDEKTIAVMWEGGWRAYRNTQYSYDWGATWSKPVDTFPWLIGENGSTEFIRDSNGTLYAFVAQRIREGFSSYTTSDGNDLGLWYSVWLGGQKWREPIMTGANVPMVNPKLAIVSGNTVVATWHSGEDDEVRSIIGRIVGAPSYPSKVWSKNVSQTTVSPQISETVDPTASLTPTSTSTALPVGMISYPSNSSDFSISTGLIIAMVSLGTIMLILFLVYRAKRSLL